MPFLYKILHTHLFRRMLKTNVYNKKKTKNKVTRSEAPESLKSLDHSGRNPIPQGRVLEGMGFGYQKTRRSRLGGLVYRETDETTSPASRLGSYKA